MEAHERLFSLDLLRGLDMFLLRTVVPLVGACNQIWHFSPGFMRQFNHFWGGFTLLDIIMPLFIFMCGAAVPLALPKRMENGRAGLKYWKHVASRVALLWVLGMVCQGNLLTLDVSQFALYTNTLQAIASGYVIAAVALTIRNVRVRQILPFALVAVYTVLLACCGDYSKEGNFAYVFELKLETALPFIGNTLGGHYTWFLTTFMFGAMTLFGMQATELLRSDRAPWRKAGLLTCYGVALLAVGWLLVPVVPMIKQIFTASFTMQAMGWSMLAYAALYVLTDIWKFRRGFGLFILYGQSALMVYMLGSWGLFYQPLELAAKNLTVGFPHLLGGETYQPIVVSIVYVTLLTTVVWFYRKAKGAK